MSDIDIFIYLLVVQTVVINIIILVVGIVLKEYLIEVINNQKIDNMKWLPIDRDEDGFATEECTKEALKQLPIVIRGYDELGEYHHLLTEDSLECDKMAIFKFKTYTHYLPIPKI